MTFYKVDCRRFSGEKPCLPNKQEGFECGDCPRYDPVSRRYLVVKLAAVGDVLRTTALLEAFARESPRPAVWWITEPSAAPLLERHPGLDVLLTTRDPLAGILSSVRFDRAFGLDMDRASAGLLSLARAGEKRGFGLSEEGAVVPVHAGAEAWFRTGIFDAPKRENRKSYPEHLFEMCGIPFAGEEPRLHLSEEEMREAASFARTRRLFRFRALVGVNVGAGGRWAAKRMPPARLAELVRLLRRRRKGLGVLLLGGPEEREVLGWLTRRLKSAAVSAGADNPLRLFAAKVALCDVLVTADTLALHVGVALGKRVVSFFGPTSAAEIELYGRGEKVVPDSCDCFYLSTCRRRQSCLATLPLQEFVPAVERQLKAAGK